MVALLSRGRALDAYAVWCDERDCLCVAKAIRPDRVGGEAVDLMIALINARTGVERRRLVQPVLVPRQSTRRPATTIGA